MTIGVGGPWDVCGALLVMQAGGAVKAFSRTQDGFQEVDALDVLQVDLFVCAANQQILDELCEIVGIKR